MPHDTVRIAVLSDTHLPDSEEARAFLAYLLEDVLAPVDLVLHAGDLVSPDLLAAFDPYPLHAVRGNMDPASPGIPIKKRIQVNGFAIGLIHGWGPAEGLAERAYQEFAGTPIDCLVYGHSHQPACYQHGGVLFFNPGSATDRRRMTYHSVGLLEIDETIRGTIIPLD